MRRRSRARGVALSSSKLEQALLDRLTVDLRSLDPLRNCRSLLSSRRRLPIQSAARASRRAYFTAARAPANHALRGVAF